MRALAAGFVIVFALAQVALGDAISELASFSAFPKADLAALSKSEAKPVRSGASGRYLALQTAYVVPQAPAEVASRMQSWNPARHPELKVFIHGESTSDFSRLRSAPDNGAVRYLATATAQKSSDLQLSASEMQQLNAPADTNPGAVLAAAWPKVLQARAQAFASGGSAAQAPYENSSSPVRPNEELRGMLGSQGKIAKQFAGLLDSTGIGRGGGGGDGFWELLSADEKGVLTLGASYKRSVSGGAVQTASAMYYASGGYYAGITLHQLWPVQVDGKPATLVWRGDMISSASVGGLRGIERIAAESTMIKDVSRAVSLFRRDLGGAR